MIFNMTGGKKPEDPLNFQVKAYPSETELKADNPSENTIGVCTTTTISSWAFSATEPTEPEAGMVWIVVGNSSSVDFNALKSNKLQVYPISVKQYEGDTWVNKTAMSYQDDEWSEWAKYLFRYGKQDYKWSASNMRSGIASNNTGVAPTISSNSDGSVNISLSHSTNSSCSGMYVIEGGVDLTDIATLTVDLEIKGNLWYVALSVFPINADAWGDDTSNGGDTVACLRWEKPGNKVRFTESLDVSSVTGKHLICIGLQVAASLPNGVVTFNTLDMRAK